MKGEHERSLVSKGRNRAANKVSIAKADLTITLSGENKTYNEVISQAIRTDSGLFIIHQMKNGYYFEIPVKMLDKEILLLTNIIQAPSGYRGSSGYISFSGDIVGQEIIIFSKGPGRKLFLRKTKGFLERSLDTTVNGVGRSLETSSLQPIAMVFDIKTYNTDSSAIIIDISEYLKGDVSLILNEQTKLTLGQVGTFQQEKSYLEKIESFPENTQVRTVKSYLKYGVEPVTYVLNTSFVLLPQQQMKERSFDPGVGYAGYNYFDLDMPGGAGVRSNINRYRLEPKEGDIQKYLSGKLVEPKKPIIFYIDPATPKKWVPFLIESVNVWQNAFEKAGFKNAIYALEVSANDTSWLSGDARYNTIVYKPSSLPNCLPKIIADPRSGEILSAQISLFHGIQGLLKKLYFVQAGCLDERARKGELNDSLMGSLLQLVCTNAVGRSLGLVINAGASSTVPVDSLRSKTYLAKDGLTPSIMEYVQFNYIAQPEDSIDAADLMPKIGIYDKWAIEWGYKWFPEKYFNNQDEERLYFREWVTRTNNKEKRTWFGGPQSLVIVDSRSLPGDLGDDQVKAGTYGIKNLQRLMKNFYDWAPFNGNQYNSDLNDTYFEVVTQYVRYLLFAFNNVFATNINYVTRDMPEKKLYANIPINKRKESLAFINRYFTDSLPSWLFNIQLLKKAGLPVTVYQFQVQRLMINAFVNVIYYTNSIMNERLNNNSNDLWYSQILNDLEKSIWKELYEGKNITAERKVLQKMYTEKFVEVIDIAFTPDSYEKGDWKLRIDYPALIRQRAKNLINLIRKQSPRFNDESTRLHFNHIRNRLEAALKNRGKSSYSYVEPVYDNFNPNVPGFDKYGGLSFDSIFNSYDLYPGEMYKPGSLNNNNP
jgi:hypothetical protein